MLCLDIGLRREGLCRGMHVIQHNGYECIYGGIVVIIIFTSD